MRASLFTSGLACIMIVLVMSACEEELPGIIFNEPEKPLLDTTYSVTAPIADLKRVLIADITGVRCNNCPEAAISAKNIADANPGRVVVMALFPKMTPDVLTRPWAGYDTLVSQEAFDWVSLLGSITSLPTGTVDQVKQSGSFFVPHTGWAGAVNSRLSVSTPVNLDLTGRWLPAENKARLEVRAIYNQDAVNGNTHILNIGIIENKIIGKQSNKDTAGGIQYGYQFEHVFRKLITPVTGDTIRTASLPGQVTEKHYYINPRYNWNPKNLYGVVWVTDASTREVLHVAEVPLK